MLIEIRTTKIFSAWFSGLRDRQARARIQARIDRAELGILETAVQWVTASPK